MLITLRIFSFFCLFSASLCWADTCPDFKQATQCVGLTQGGVCQGWTIRTGLVTHDSQFLRVLTRSAFPFIVGCQYDAGRLSLIKLQQAIPTSPYLWFTQSIAGLNFDSCVSSLQSCSFTLIG